MATYEPTDAEMEILQVIWEMEPVAVRDVYEKIAAHKEVGYTTVLKQIQRLMEKGVLAREDRDGTHYYKALARESEVKSHLAGKMLHSTFGGSALQMMLHALGNEKASVEELQALKAFLDQQTDQK